MCKGGIDLSGTIFHYVLIYLAKDGILKNTLGNTNETFRVPTTIIRGKMCVKNKQYKEVDFSIPSINDFYFCLWIQ
jgi:hypothetical protein